MQTPTDKKQDTNNIQKTNNKQIYDFDRRTLKFAKAVIQLCRSLQKELINNRLIDQLTRSGSSIGANYIEANDALGRKDFIHRLRIARKEAKETIYWLELLHEGNNKHGPIIIELTKEAVELKNILSAMINKAQS